MMTQLVNQIKKNFQFLTNKNVDLQKILTTQRDIRRKPFVNAASKFDGINHFLAEEHISSAFVHTESTVSPTTISALAVPDTMCPDGSDALLKDGLPVQCGTGSDGFNLCPRGHYCSIDPDQNGIFY